MTAPDSRMHWTVVVGIAAGSVTGALLRWAANLVIPISSGSAVISPLAISAGSGAILGVVLGATLARRASTDLRPPLAAALVAAIGTFSAGAALEGSPETAASTEFWRGALVNAAITILAAGACVSPMRRWRRS